MAVGIVVLFHAGVGALPGGFVGVDVFFVISGYLISRIVWSECQEGRFSFRSFYIRRVRRILPTLCVVLFATLLLGCGVLFAAELDILGRSALMALWFVPNIYFWRNTGYFELDAAATPLLHTWSLGVEEQFYLLFPMALFAVHRYLPRFLVLFICLGLLGSLGASIWATKLYPAFSFYQMPARAWELLLGATLGLGLVNAPRRRLLGELAAALGLFMIAASALLIDEHQPFPGYLALLPCLGSWLFIWGCSGGTPVAGRLLASRAAVALGLGSYSLYLWHWPVVVFVDLIIPGGGTILLKIGLALALSVLSYHYVEKPFRFGMTQRRSLAAIAAMVALLTGLSGVLIVSQGLPSRVPDSVALLAESDRLRPENRGCHGQAIDEIAVTPTCSLGAPEGEVRFVLLGDSHADALNPALQAAGAAVGFRGLQITHPGCAPLRGLMRTTQRHCGPWLESAIATIRNLPAVEFVVLSGYWRPYLQGHSYRHRSFHLLKDSSVVADSERLAEVEAAMHSTAEALRGFNLIFVDDVAEIGATFGAGLVKNWARIQWLGLDAVIAPHHSIQEDEYLAEIEWLRRRLGSQLLWIDPKDYLCPAQRCPILQDGRLLYRDGDHLTPTGARQVAPAFVDLFSGAV